MHGSLPNPDAGLTQSRCVSHMLYADDLGFTTNDPGEMQAMLNKLRTYAEKKGLTVNTAKSEVVHY